MGGLVVGMWIMAILAGGFVLICFIGMFLEGRDEAKANRYLAAKFDEERRKKHS